MKAGLITGVVLLVVFAIVALIAPHFAKDADLTLSDRLAAELAFRLSLLLLALTALAMLLSVLVGRHWANRRMRRR